MAIEFACPTCQTHIRVDQAAAGKMARCPKCQGICRVPETSSPPPQTFPSQPLTPLGSGDPFGSASPAKQPSPFDPLPSGNQPAKANPFGDFAQPSGGVGGGPLNPYASPAYASSPLDRGPLTTDEVRMKLLGPAIGIVIGALLCLGYVGLTLIGLMANRNGRFADDLAMFGVFAAMGLPSLIMLIGSFAMFRGKGLPLAWAAAVAAVIPCNPCCLVSLGFGIWGIVMLCDPRVSQAMR